MPSGAPLESGLPSGDEYRWSIIERETNFIAFCMIVSGSHLGVAKGLQKLQKGLEITNASQNQALEGQSYIIYIDPLLRCNAKIFNLSYIDCKRVIKVSGDHVLNTSWADFGQRAAHNVERDLRETNVRQRDEERL